jgi:hypothetical protein
MTNTREEITYAKENVIIGWKNIIRTF